MPNHSIITEKANGASAAATRRVSAIRPVIAPWPSEPNSQSGSDPCAMLLIPDLSPRQTANAIAPGSHDPERASIRIPATMRTADVVANPAGESVWPNMVIGSIFGPAQVPAA